MRKRLMTMVLVGLALSASSAAGFTSPPELPLQERIAKADLVVVGQVVQESRELYTDGSWTWVNSVRIEAVVKGSAPKVIEVDCGGVISEMRSECRKGRRYLMILQRTANKRFAPINAPHGTYEIPA